MRDQNPNRAPHQDYRLNGAVLGREVSTRHGTFITDSISNIHAGVGTGCYDEHWRLLELYCEPYTLYG